MRKLFRRMDGSPMKFYLVELGEEDLAKFTNDIVSNGGKVVSKEKENVLTFTFPQFCFNYRVVFNLKFIQDCIKENKILNVDDYYIGDSRVFLGCPMSKMIVQSKTCLINQLRITDYCPVVNESNKKEEKREQVLSNGNSVMIVDKIQDTSRKRPYDNLLTQSTIVIETDESDEDEIPLIRREKLPGKKKKISENREKTPELMEKSRKREKPSEEKNKYHENNEETLEIIEKSGLQKRHSEEKKKRHENNEVTLEIIEKSRLQKRHSEEKKKHHKNREKTPEVMEKSRIKEKTVEDRKKPAENQENFSELIQTPRTKEKPFAEKKKRPENEERISEMSEMVENSKTKEMEKQKLNRLLDGLRKFEEIVIEPVKKISNNPELTTKKADINIEDSRKGIKKFASSKPISSLPEDTGIVFDTDESEEDEEDKEDRTLPEKEKKKHFKETINSDEEKERPSEKTKCPSAENQNPSTNNEKASEEKNIPFQIKKLTKRETDAILNDPELYEWIDKLNRAKPKDEYGYPKQFCRSYADWENSNIIYFVERTNTYDRINTESFWARVADLKLVSRRRHLRSLLHHMNRQILPNIEKSNVKSEIKKKFIIMREELKRRREARL